MRGEGLFEIKGRDDLEKWLEKQPQAVSCAIAARVALRALPNCVNLVEKDPEQWADALVLTIFRALAPP